MIEDYCVRLDAFEGPLDLLLHLIRRAEVEVHDIPVAMIAEQYERYLEHVDTIDIDLAGEFLVMAATLMEIKSRMLSPQARAAADGSEGGTPAGEDPRADLVRQLIEYKRHRDAAEALDARRATWQRRFPAGAALPDPDSLASGLIDASESVGDGLDLDDLSLLDLASAFARIIEAVNLDRLGDHQVTYDDTPTELHQADILDRLLRESACGEVPLARVLEGRTRAEMVGMFIATLELVRQRRIRVRQDAPGDQVLLCLAPEPEPEAPPADEPGSEAAGPDAPGDIDGSSGDQAEG